MLKIEILLPLDEILKIVEEARPSPHTGVEEPWNCGCAAACEKINRGILDLARDRNPDVRFWAEPQEVRVAWVEVSDDFFKKEFAEHEEVAKDVEFRDA